MARRRARMAPEYALDTERWTLHKDCEVVTEYRIHGRRVTPGTELSIRGERGRYRFRHAVTSPSGAHWIDVVGGPESMRRFRSFYPERVKRVHGATRAPEADENFLPGNVDMLELTD